MKRLSEMAILSLSLVTLAAQPAFARPPLFTLDPIPDQTAQSTVLFSYQVSYTVYDPVCFGELLGYALLTAPAGMTIDGAGRLRWTPTTAQGGGTYGVTIRATASRLAGSPCYGGTFQDYEDYQISVQPAPGSTPPTSAVNVELSETAMNNVLATLTEVRGFNFGDYVAGFVDAWWVNLDSAQIDILAPSGGHNRARLNVVANANVVLDLFILDLPISATDGGWIEGNVDLLGSVSSGYKVVLHPTSMSLLAAIALGLTVGGAPDVELNLGTEITPLFGCVKPTLVTSSDRSAFILQWTQRNLTDCQVQVAQATE